MWAGVEALALRLPPHHGGLWGKGVDGSWVGDSPVEVAAYTEAGLTCVLSVDYVPHSCPLPLLTTQGQSVSGFTVQEAAMSSQVGGVPGVDSGASGSLIEA